MAIPTARRLCLVLAATASLCLLFYAAMDLAQAQTGKPGPAKFTLKAVEPRPEKEELLLVFSTFVPLETLRENLRLTPRVRIDWNKSRAEQNGQVVLKGAFRYGYKHLITLPEDMRVGEAVFTPGVTSFVMPERKARIEFLDARRVVERDSRQMIHLRARNVDAVMLETTILPALLVAQAEAAQTDAKTAEGVTARLSELAKGLTPVAASVSGLAAFAAAPETEKRLYSVRGEKNKDRPFSLPLSLRKNAAAGAVILARVSDAKEGGAPPAPPKILGVTDLGITYKRGAGQLLLWVTSLREGTPKSGVTLAGLTKNGEAFALGATDSSGVLLFTPGERKGVSLGLSGPPAQVSRRLDPAEITHVLAAAKDDVAHMRLLPRGNVTPMGVTMFTPGEPVPGLRGLVFTERGVYRPGETAHYKALVRQFADNKVISPAGRQCQVSLAGPRGDTVYEHTLNLSEFGAISGDIAIPGHWPRGEYTLSVRYAKKADKKKPAQDEDFVREKGEDNVARTVFQVQEFRAPRHYAELSFSRASRPVEGMINRSGSIEVVRIAVSGLYYAGGPVKNGQVRWKIFAADTDFPVPAFKEYRFGYQNGEQERPVLVESGQDTLDDNGKAVIELPLDRSVLSGRSGLAVTASVVDFDGRASSATQVFQVEPEVKVGVNRHDKEAPAGSNVELTALALDAKGEKLANAAFEAQIYERAYVNTARRNDRGDVVFDSDRVWRKLRQEPLKTDNGLARFNLDLAGFGDYMVVFSATVKGKTYASSTIVESSGADFASSYEARKLAFTPLTLAANQAAFEPGQTARVSWRAGKAVSHYLVTFERDAILGHKVIQAKGDLENVSLGLTQEHAPNVYVSVLGVIPRGDFPALSGRYDAEAPGFVMGSLDLPVARSYAPLSVAIAPDKPDLTYQPGQKVELELTAKDAGGGPVDAEMAVAVVMESVLALTGFKTPELTGLTRFDMPLAVFTGDLRTLLIHQTPFYMARSEPLTGGDGGAAMDAITKLRRRFSPVAYYNPSLRTGPRGKAQIAFTLPDSMTSYRVYAVASDTASAFACAERRLLAVKDFYLEPGLPDFFTKGDSFVFQVAAFNNSATPGQVGLAVKSDPVLNLVPPAATTEIAANSSIKLPVSGQAVAPGKTSVTFQGTMGGASDAMQAQVRVNSGQALQTILASGQADGPGQLKVPKPAAKPAPEAEAEAKASIILSASPYLRLGPALRQLIDYPFGCVEQTASGLIGAAAFTEAVTAGDVPGLDPAALKAWQDKAVARLLAMQTASGGFGYWPGARSPHALGSLYAALSLTLLAKAQPGAFAPAVKLARDYLKAELDNLNRPAWHRAFAAYVLALNGALDKQSFAELDKNWARQSRETKLWLLLAGSQAKFVPAAELKRRLGIVSGEGGESASQSPDDEFRAVYRAPALALLAASAIAPKGPEQAKAAQALLAGINDQGIWTSTSDTGLALAAFAQYLRGSAFPKEPAGVTVSQPGQAPIALSVDPKTGAEAALDAKVLLSQPQVSIETAPGATLLYRIALTLPRPDIDASGQSQGIGVRKTIENIDATQTIKTGDLVKITLTVTVPGAPVRYLAINDPLPAGLMAINAAFKTEEPMPGPDDEEGEPDTFSYFTTDGSYRPRASHFEIRDDRALIFQDRTYTGAHVYEYFARAVCQGDFIVPATKAEAMYQPGLAGFSPAGKLTVLGR